MDLIDREKLIKTIPSEEMVARMAVMSAPVVDAIPVEWIEQYLYDLAVGNEEHVLNIGEILSMSDEEYYLKHLIKRWEQEKQNEND